MIKLSSIILLTLAITAECGIVKRNTDDVLTVETSEKSEEDKTKDSNLNAMKEYFRKYTIVDTETPRTSQVSSDGTIVEEEVDITQTPSFMDAIASLQRAANQKVTGVISLETIDQSQKARCGMPDLNQEGDGPAAYSVKAKWEDNKNPKTGTYDLTYGFDLNSVPSMISRQHVKEGVIAAMCMWEKNSNIRFTKEVSYKQAKITISFGSRDHGDGYDFDGRGGTLAHAFYPQNGRLHFDSDEDWYLSKDDNNDRKKKDIFTVGAHELGHNLGLEHSEYNTALMAPFYNFQGSYDTYKLPNDDLSGVTNMYGRKLYFDPDRDESACKTLKEKYGSNKPKEIPPSKKTTTTTTTTTSPSTKKATNTFSKKPKTGACEDDAALGGFCAGWKTRGYCEAPREAAAMRRNCKKTCDLCTKSPKSICEIGNIDSMTPLYDYSGYYDIYYFKDDYYIRGTSLVNKTLDKDVNLLNRNFDLGPAFKFYSDPKTYIPGSYKYKKSTMFSQNSDLRSALVGTNFYLVFEGGKSGTVSQYTKGAPTMTHVDSSHIKNLFPDFPHVTVDGSYWERNERREKIYTLFHGQKFWQYKEKSANLYDGRINYQLQFEPVANKSNVHIKHWYGSHACNVDGVFSYEGNPYFLKDNLFWPASTKLPQVARDIRYYFMRCDNAKPDNYPIPGCVSAGSASSFLSANYLLFFTLTFLSLIPHWLL